MALNQTFGWYLYVDDEGNNFGIKLTPTMAGAGGFNTAGVPDGQTYKAWPYHAKHLRHVSAKATINQQIVRRRFPMAATNSANYRIGAIFSYEGQSWAVEGTIGESKDGRNASPFVA